ncbi:MAG: response regulator [Ignavibacteriota bacterium]
MERYSQLPSALNILIADDDDDDILFFVAAFSELRANATINSVGDGKQLMDHLLDNNTVLPDLLILDLNMPKKSGLECLVEIRKHPKLGSLPIAIYSTSRSERDVQETFLNGATKYIPKPNDIQKLKALIPAILNLDWHRILSSPNRDEFLLLA